MARLAARCHIDASSVVIEQESKIAPQAKNIQARAPPSAGQVYFDVVSFARTHRRQICYPVSLVSLICCFRSRYVERDCYFFVIAELNRLVIAETVAELNPVGAVPGAVRKARDLNYYLPRE